MMDLAPYRSFLIARSGLSFENDRLAILEAGIRARLAATGTSPAGYLALLRRNEEEFLALVEEVTVKETYFFREPAHLELLEKRVAPELLQYSGGGRPLRIVSAGCSTGEEAYSIAIALFERFGADAPLLFSVIAADINQDSLERGKAGLYGRKAFRGFRDELLERHFERAGHGARRVREHLRSLVSFHPVNLRGNRYPEVMRRADIIYYRNVSIYFSPEVRREIFANLAESLNDPGYLFVSATETLGHDIGILPLEEIGGTFVFRKGGEAPAKAAAQRFPATPGVSPRRPAVSRTPSVGVRATTGPPPVPLSAGCPAKAAGAESSLFGQAVARARDKEYATALELLDRLLAAEPDLVPGHTLRGAILLNLERWPEATAACREALQRDRWSLEGHLLLGMIARQEEQPEEAARRFREALFIDASCWLAHYYLAEILASRGEVPGALREYGLVIKNVGSGPLPPSGLTLFPLSIQAAELVALCRRNVARLTRTG